MTSARNKLAITHRGLCYTHRTCSCMEKCVARKNRLNSCIMWRRKYRDIFSVNGQGYHSQSVGFLSQREMQKLLWIEAMIFSQNTTIFGGWWNFYFSHIGIVIPTGELWRSHIFQRWNSPQISQPFVGHEEFTLFGTPSIDPLWADFRLRSSSYRTPCSIARAGCTATRPSTCSPWPVVPGAPLFLFLTVLASEFLYSFMSNVISSICEASIFSSMTKVLILLSMPLWIHLLPIIVCKVYPDDFATLACL